MTRDTEDQIDSILRRVLDLPDQARDAFLDETCGQHTQLRAIVRQMIAACDAEDTPLTPGGALSGPLWNELVARSMSAGLSEGDHVAAYRIVRALGQGGMATVYLAERADGLFERTVALKVLHPTKHDVGLRFAQERQILASLGHPNIAHLIDGGLAPSGHAYVALEYVDGLPIDAYCDRNGLSLRRRLALFITVARAAGFAHRNLVIHRDIKPSNILVTADGVPKLLDFGIAKLLDESMPHAAPETRSALHPMTPEYASPEQVRGEPLTTACDVYQLGYLLYGLLTGASPYRVDRRNYAAVVEAICRSDPVPPSQAASSRRPDGERRARETVSAPRQSKLSADIDAIVMKALRKEPEARYSSAERFADDVERYLCGLPVTARRGSTGYRARKLVRRHRRGAAALLAFVLLAVGFAGAWLLESHRNAVQLAAERDAARLEAAKAERVAGFVAGLLDSARPDRTKGDEVTVLELLDAGAARVDAELADQPDVRARMLGVIADSYFELGRYQKAREFSTRQLEVETETWGMDDPRIARTLRRLGEHAYADGDLEAARGALERALALHARGPQADAERGRTLGSLGLVLRALGDLAGARAAHEASLPLVEADGDREYIRGAWTNYGNLLLVTSAYDEAATAYRKALDYQDDLETTRAAGLMANIGMATAAAQRPDEGLVYFERATAIFEKLLPPDHPSLAKLYNATAECLLMLERYEESYALQKRALDIYETAFGDAHFEINFSLIELGDVFLYTARPEQAEPYYRRALRIIGDSAGEDTINASYALRKLGTVRLRLGDPEGAERLLRRALPIQKQALGDDHVRTNLTRMRLGIALVRSGRRDEARSLLDRALRIARAQSAPPDETSLAAAEGAFGEYLLASGRLRDAEPLLLSSYRATEDRADRASIIEALERLRSLYTAMDRPERAARHAALRDEVLESLRSLNFARPGRPRKGAHLTYSRID